MSDFPNPALIGTGLAGPVTPGSTTPNAQTPAPTGASFSDVLQSSSSALQFSRHAQQRIERRGIELTPATLNRLQGGAARAAAKGSRDAVVFVDNNAFVVSVRNNTVITAVGAQNLRDQVFTNIDSAVIA